MILFSDLKNQLEETKAITNDLNSKITTCEQITNEIQKEFDLTINKIETQEVISIARMHQAKGYALSSSQLLATYLSFFIAIDIYINRKNVGEFLVTVGDIHTCVNQMKESLDELKSLTDRELKKGLIDKFELDSLSYVNPTVNEYIRSWESDQFNQLYPSRIGLLRELDIKRKNIIEEVTEINRQIVNEDTNQ